VVLQKGVDICFALLSQAVLSGVLSSPITGLAFFVAGLVIAISFLFITIDFVMTKIQTFLAIGMGFFFFGFGGSTWTRTYVERYFAYAVSSGVRLMTQYFLIGIGLTLSGGWLAAAQNAPWSLDGVKAGWYVMFSAILFAILCWRGSAIAAQLLGGGPNLSHSEVFHAMGTAVQAGIASALVASSAGGAAAAVGAANGPVASIPASSGGASSPGTGRTPASAPPASANGAGRNGGSGTMQAASAAASAFHSAGSGGTHQVHPPVFNGFGRD
jgi:type IV secretion system protein TrbL